MFARISLFDLHTYRVILRKRSPIILARSLSFGNYFDIPSGKPANLHRSYRGMLIIQTNPIV